MGIFDGFKKKDIQDGESVDEGSSKKVKPSKAKAKVTKVNKKGKKNKRKTKTLVEVMGLRDAVAVMGIKSFNEALSDASAVRSVSDGFIAIAFTNEMLEASGLDAKSEDFGAFADGIRTTNIKSFTLANDLADGRVVLIPDEITLELLDEYGFIHDWSFEWVIVPHDIRDDGRVIVCDNTVPFSDLMSIASTGEVLAYSNGVVELASTDIDESNDEDLIYEEHEVEDIPETVMIDLEDDDDLSDASDDDLIHEVNGNVDLELGDDSSIVSEIGAYPTFDAYEPMDDNNALSDDDVFIDPTESMVPYSDENGAAETVKRVLSREFYSPDLRLNVDGSIFEAHFNGGMSDIVQFPETLGEDTELNRTLLSMAKDANAELARLNQTQNERLRNEFMLNSAKLHDDIVAALDLDTDANPFGKIYQELQAERSELHDALDYVVRDTRKEMDEAYERDRDASGKRGYEDAVAKFDDLNRKNHERLGKALFGEMSADADASMDKKESEFYETRRDAAARLYDKGTTAILADIHEKSKVCAKDSLLLFDNFRHKFDTYLRDQYSNEIMKAKAIDAANKQRHEAEVVRQELEQVIAARDSRIKSQEYAANEALLSLKNSHESTIRDLKENHADKSVAAREEIQRYVAQINQLNEDLRTSSDRKDKEFVERENAYKDTIASQRLRLEADDERSNKTTRTAGLLLACGVITALVVGLLGGYLWGGQSAPAQADPIIQVVPQAYAPAIVPQLNETNPIEEPVEEEDVTADSAVTETPSSEKSK